MRYDVVTEVPSRFCLEVVDMDKRSLRRFPLDADDVVKLYRSGISASALAAKYGCSFNAISNCLNRSGIHTTRDWKDYLFRKSGVTPDDLLAMYNSGMWKYEIAHTLGISEGGVGRFLARLGVPLADSRSSAMKDVHKKGGKEWSANASKPAHEAVRGMKRTDADLIKRAAGKERTGKFGSVMERVLYDMLIERGLSPVPQKAIHKYNIDLMVGDVAVEITGRGRKPKDIPAIKERIKYLLNSGYSVVWVWGSIDRPIESGAADYIVAYCEAVSRDPSLIGENRVIRRDGKLIAVSRSNDDNFPGVFSAKGGAWSRP